MSLSLLQVPATASLAQSPIIFSILESGGVTESSSFQYVGELYFWTGSLTNSGSAPQYTIVKYPNTQNVGIFDLNRIINSTLTQQATAFTSSVVYYATDFYFQYYNGTGYVTGSHLKTATYKALDGYGVFQEPIGQQIYSKSPHWPLMTDGPATQSCFVDNYGIASVYVGEVGTTTPTKIVYTSALGTADYAVSGNTTTTGQIVGYPIGPAESTFPLSGTITSFTTQAYSSGTPLGTAIQYDVVCTQKYPNIRIKWKNRYGQFDWMNFNMINRKSFSTERKTYSPQLGSWESTTLTYQNYDSATLAYIVDSKQAISVNTNWLSDSYNDILKQLLVSDEIYWITNESTNALTPLTITTQNIQFRTGVNDKLIQYQFDFQLGQPYKLIL
jgi:hypothetical protein